MDTLVVCCVLCAAGAVCLICGHEAQSIATQLYSGHRLEVIFTIHVVMRDEKEGRKKQARSNKQQGKATQHTQGSTPAWSHY